jgi:hypothetical protein
MGSTSQSLLEPIDELPAKAQRPDGPDRVGFSHQRVIEPLLAKIPLLHGGALSLQSAVAVQHLSWPNSRSPGRVILPERCRARS